jgi:hypothetical protein
LKPEDFSQPIVESPHGQRIIEAFRFETFMLQGIEWQQKVAIKTESGKYRVEITWALDRYRVSVWRRVQEPEKLVEVRHPLFARTAVETANRLLRRYNKYSGWRGEL